MVSFSYKCIEEPTLFKEDWKFRSNETSGVLVAGMTQGYRCNQLTRGQIDIYTARNHPIIGQGVICTSGSHITLDQET